MSCSAEKRQRASWPRRSRPLLGGLLVLGMLAGCTTQYYRQSADKEVYRTIQEKTPLVRNMDSQFTVEQTNILALTNLPIVQTVPDFLGPDARQELGASILSLEQALAIAVRHNRTYQSRKEQLYLSALRLTLARHEFAPLFSAPGGGRIVGSTQEAVDTVVDPVTGESRVVLSDNLEAQRQVSAAGGINVSWLLRDVGRLTASFTTDFLRYITGDPRTVTSSKVNATLTRPLLQNAAYKTQLESLTQAERDLLYALRDFTQFRKDFTVQVATAYYGVLGRRDAARNDFLKLQSSRKNAERTRALTQEGRATQAGLGRLAQQELTAETDWINRVRGYQQALDDFKLLQLGLPVDVAFVLDDGELEALQIQHPKISVEDAIDVALAARLDYQNAKDEHDDSVRRVTLAANYLKPQMDLLASAGFSSGEQSSGFPVPDPERYSWSAGLDVDLPLDRKAERNLYRNALIEEKQAARAMEQLGDEIKLQVRQSWRNLDQAKQSFEISEVGVELAERRVEEQNLLAEVGRANAQDQVDTQNDLNLLKNQRTQALVGHTIARLQFWNNMGVLFIKDTGQWQEVTDARRP